MVKLGVARSPRPRFTTDLKHLSSDAEAGVRELLTKAIHALSDKRILSAESTVGCDRVFHSAPMSLEPAKRGVPRSVLDSRQQRV